MTFMLYSWDGRLSWQVVVPRKYLIYANTRWSDPIYQHGIFDLSTDGHYFTFAH